MNIARTSSWFLEGKSIMRRKWFHRLGSAWKVNHTLETYTITKNIHLRCYNCKVTYPLSTIRFFLHNETAMIDQFMSLKRVTNDTAFPLSQRQHTKRKTSLEIQMCNIQRKKSNCPLFLVKQRNEPIVSSSFSNYSFARRVSSLSSKTVLRLIETHNKEFSCLFLPRFRN